MQALDKILRNRLERTVRDARDCAETAARAALGQLGVGEATPFDHLTEDERALRRRLRAHGRQLGDTLNGGQTQTMERLIEEVAYQHWHRMLFARFLAENNLLMYPDPDDPVAVTLEECEDLAADEGAANGWDLAARFAARMLPQIFRPDSPVFQLVLPPEHQHRLERLVADLPLEVFTASDSLGWVYQFWQAKRKDEVNASEVKIGARELPAVTQLFTEPYMVSFLLDNSLGAWWAARRLSPDDLNSASGEEELRQKAAIPGVPLDYLRFVKVSAPLSGEGQDERKSWLPAAGTFSGWPATLADFKLLDPCCGSGHFLVAAFLMLVPMRMAAEGLSAREAVNAVLRDNLHGLEIDPRCVEIAVFALALAAWRYPDEQGHPLGVHADLPRPQVACCGLKVAAKPEDWMALVPDQSAYAEPLREGLRRRHRDFSQAPLLGSLLAPSKASGDLFTADYTLLADLLEAALRAERQPELWEDTSSAWDLALSARGLLDAARLLEGRYHLVVTNVPYLARGKQDDTLKAYCATHYPEAKNDLANVFLERCLELASPPKGSQGGGVVQIVMPQNWLFLTSYKKQRESLLRRVQWNLLARLGPGAFETISGEVVKAVLLTQTHAAATEDFQLRGVDASAPKASQEKMALLREGGLAAVSQKGQLGNPDARIALQDAISNTLLERYAFGLQGVSTSDNQRFRFNFWELSSVYDGWRWFQGGVDSSRIYGGGDSVIWLSKLIELYELARDEISDESDFQERRAASNASGVYLRGQAAWSRKGVAVRQMRHLPVCLTQATPFDTNTAVVLPHKEEHLAAIWCFGSSPEYHEAVRRIDQKLNVTNATLVKVPFDLDHWTKVAAEKYPNGLPKPYTDDPTQWIFHGHPCGSVVWDEEEKWTAPGPRRSDDTVLQVAVARLVGYRWPAETDPTMELADEARAWIDRCAKLAVHADEDGIVCIPPVRGEASASDRLLNLLAAAYGDVWTNDTLAVLLKNADHGGKSLETWLRDKFYSQRCKLFHHRPFIWHIWDGLRDGFAALVNYHKLNAKLLETLIYTYLGDWINRQKQDIASGVDGAQERMAAAEALKNRLELILIGDDPYDIFLRWKPLAEQPIGWNPDLNDGVRLNIRPFLSRPDLGKRGAGILRDKPNIKWDKDRGSDVPSAPWYHLSPQYGGKPGDRINEHHLTLAEKRAAREDAA